MGKKAEQNRVTDSRGVSLEHNTIIDDNLLPSADELAKLKIVSPDILPWIMSRTELEQNARIRFNDGRLDLAGRDLRYNHRYNFMALFMAFIIVLMFMAFSFYLIINNQETIGTMFAGGTAVLIVSYFLKASKGKEKK